MVGYGGSSAGSYLANPTSPIPSHCASIVATSTLRVNSIGTTCELNRILTYKTGNYLQTNYSASEINVAINRTKDFIIKTTTKWTIYLSNGTSIIQHVHIRPMSKLIQLQLFTELFLLTPKNQGSFYVYESSHTTKYGDTFIIFAWFHKHITYPTLKNSIANISCT